MSNRTIIEFNHDYADIIDRKDFSDALKRYLSNGDELAEDKLKGFGCTIHGTRHHSDKPWADIIRDGKKK